MSHQNDQSPRERNISTDIDQFRDEICRLYVREKRSLKDIMVIMKEKGCYTTRNMYLKKFKAWGLQKYKNQDRLIQARTRPNGETGPLQIQGRTISLGEIDRYFERKIYHHTGEEVFEYISRPSSSLKQPDDLDISNQLFNSLYNTQRWFVSMDVTKVSEPQEDVYNVLHHSFCPDMANGMELIWLGEYQAGGALIERAFQRAEEVLNMMDPQLLHPILYFGISALEFQLDGFAKLFFSYIYRLSSKSLGANHALTRLFGLLNKRRDQLMTMHTGLRVLYDATVDIAGKTDFRAIWIKKAYLGSNLSKLLNPPMSELYSQYESFLLECDELSTPTPGIAARRDLAEFYINDRQTTQGLLILREVVPILYKTPPPSKVTAQAAVLSCYNLGEKLMLISTSEIVSDDDGATLRKYYLEAEEILKITIERSTILLGPENSATLMAAETLAHMYEKYGHSEDSSIQLQLVLDQLAEYRLS